jgi:hypothetical protein
VAHLTGFAEIPSLECRRGRIADIDRENGGAAGQRSFRLCPKPYRHKAADSVRPSKRFVVR